jgi:hypothetical protein
MPRLGPCSHVADMTNSSLPPRVCAPRPHLGNLRGATERLAVFNSMPVCSNNSAVPCSTLLQGDRHNPCPQHLLRPHRTPQTTPHPRPAGRIPPSLRKLNQSRLSNHGCPEAGRGHDKVSPTVSATGQQQAATHTSRLLMWQQLAQQAPQARNGWDTFMCSSAHQQPAQVTH